MIRTGLIVSAIAIAIMAGVSLWTGARLPAENIPVHWNASGVADRFADKNEALFVIWLMPAISAFGALLFALLPQVEPMRENLFKSRKAYNAVWIATMILLLAVHGGVAAMMVQVDGSTVPADEFVRLVFAGTGLLYVIIGNYLPKTRQNWFLGIRTPWTLSSEYTWEKTHRLAGRLFLIVGITCIISAFVLNGITIVFVMTGGAIGAALISVVYSFLVYRNAPDKRVSPDYVV